MERMTLKIRFSFLTVISIKNILDRLARLSILLCLTLSNYNKIMLPSIRIAHFVKH